LIWVGLASIVGASGRVLFTLSMLTRYAHMWDFVCPDCKGTVSVVRVCDEKNLEELEEQQFKLMCLSCEKRFERPGYLAKSHFVESVVAAESSAS
jgi:uncharacterized protein YbaR (Trm112 family)